ncbi:MAG: WD40/YVTN/BNR-like repeat-containing protein, partial [Vicinamibacterales bacterium]
DDAARDTALYQFQTQDFHSLAFDPDDADTIFFGHHGGLMISEDGGANWQESTLQGVDAMQLALPNDGQRRYAAGHDVFYVSTNSGATWQPQPTNLPGLDLHAFAGSQSDPNRLYTIPLGFGLYTSADGGATWQEATLPPLAETQPMPIAVAPDEPQTVLLARSGEIASSRDAGMTWEREPGPAGVITALAVAADDRQSIYAGTTVGVFRRTGDGWEALPVETDGATVAMAASPSEPRRIAIVDQQGNFYRSDDGGASWVGR